MGVNDIDLEDQARIFTELLCQGAIKKDIKVIIAKTTEAEAVKLFSNTYLAMRVAFSMSWIPMQKVKDLVQSR